MTRLARYAPVQEGPWLRKWWGEPCAVCGFGKLRAVHVLPENRTEDDPPKWWHKFVPRGERG